MLKIAPLQLLLFRHSEDLDALPYEEATARAFQMTVLRKIARMRFKPTSHLAARLAVSHMTVSQADPTGSMTPWRQS
jgi:hypothetical protein